MKKSRLYRVALWVLLCCGMAKQGVAQEKADAALLGSIDQQVRSFMDEGNIPGLSLVMVRGNRQTIRSYGYADLARKQPVTSATLFEIGSCSKAFTALAVARLESGHKIDLDAAVATYIPWLWVTYKDKKASITLRQLLHHTSGIPWNTIAKIPQTSAEGALEQTVRQLVGQELAHAPGEKYEYATINYDVLALVVEKVTGQPFEVYLHEQVIDKLGLRRTTIGVPHDPKALATGYKIGFFEPRMYKAPPFRGNNAAGYVISNAEDMAKWLRFQMGLEESQLYPLARATHQRDETVPPHGMASYAKGWEVSLSGNGEIYHGGLNPNYTTYVAFRPKDRLGVAVLANSNSSFTPVIANRVMKLMANEEIGKEYYPGDGNDKAFSIIAGAMSGYLVLMTVLLLLLARDAVAARRTYVGISRSTAGRLLVLVLVMLPFLLGLYVLPGAMYGFTWEAILVWTPVSLQTSVILILSAFGVTYLAYLADALFPGKNKYKSILPQLLLFSVASGLANMVVVVLLTSSLDSKVELKYLIFYYLLTLFVYLAGRRYVQVNLIRLSRQLTYELRINIVEKIFSTSYQKFEKIDRGKVYTTLNDDVDTVGDATNMFIVLVTNAVTAIGAFLYLATIAFWAALLTAGLIIILVSLYFLVIRSTNRYYEEARDTRNLFMRLVNGMIDGYKEISMSRNKKLEYKQDLATSADNYRLKIVTASIRFVNASLVGEAILIMILGVVAFAFPRLFPEVKIYTLMSFVVVILYLIGPVNTVLGSVPAVMKLRIAWTRIQAFIREIPVQFDLKKQVKVSIPAALDSIGAEGVGFKYKSRDGQSAFGVGPINFEAKKGEIVFIIGGNGSGKTTLVKLITGLYEPDEGKIRINGEVVQSSRLGEYFSTVFSPVYIFQKLYDIDLSGKFEEAAKYLELLNLEKKVEIQGKRYSTIDLSSGQRKRLALLQCYLENSPVFLFDEWAADQDPEYRHFFYRTLLPQMKEKGKIVIAVTHDEHYFDVADKIVKMDQGKMEVYANECLSAGAAPSGQPS